MLNKLIGSIRKEYIIGTLGIGTIYFGYKNFQNYFQFNQSNIKIIKNEILNENLERIYNNINKKDLLLRNGDLIFIKYNLDKLNFFNKYKLLLLRNLCFKRIFDDVGIIYTHNDNVYILLIPSIKLYNKTNIQQLGIYQEHPIQLHNTNTVQNTPENTHTVENTVQNTVENRVENGDRGVIAIELDDLIRENRPDLISVRRLICTNSIREDLLKSIKSTVIDLRNSTSPFLYLILSNWLHNFSNKDKFLNALTLYNDFNYSIQILIHTNKQLFNTLITFHNLQSYITSNSHLHSSSVVDRLDPVDRFGVVDGVDTGMDVLTGMNNEMRNEMINEIIDELIEIDEKLKNYEIQSIKYNNIINHFIQSNKKSNLGLDKKSNLGLDKKSDMRLDKKSDMRLDKKMRRVGIKRYLIGEMELINKIYIKSNLLPGNGMNFSINNFFGMDSLFNGTQESDIYLKLSSPFNIYTGSVNKIRFQNLKYPQIQDILDYKL